MRAAAVAARFFLQCFSEEWKDEEVSSVVVSGLLASAAYPLTVTLGSDADTNVWNDSTNRGTWDHMYHYSGAGRVGYVRFDLSVLGAAAIESASLTFTKAPAARNDTIVTGRFALVGLNNVEGNTAQDWSETALTGSSAGDEYAGSIAEPVDLTK